MCRAFRIKTDCNGDQMARQGNNVHIPLSTEKAIGLLLQVRPTKDMPRPGAHPTKSNMAMVDEEFGKLKLGIKKIGSKE